MIQFALITSQTEKSNLYFLKPLQIYQSALRSLRNGVGYDGQPKRRECTKCGRFPNSISASLTFALWWRRRESSSGIFNAFFSSASGFWKLWEYNFSCSQGASDSEQISGRKCQEDSGPKMRDKVLRAFKTTRQNNWRWNHIIRKHYVANQLFTSW